MSIAMNQNVNNIYSVSSNASTDSPAVFSTLLFLPCYFLAFPEDKKQIEMNQEPQT